MTRDQFIAEVGAIFDKAANYTGSSSRTFIESERTSFLGQMYEFMEKNAAGKIDFTSPQFFWALKRVEQKFISVQDQCAHLESYFQEEIAKALAAQKTKKNP